MYCCILKLFLIMSNFVLDEDIVFDVSELEFMELSFLEVLRDMWEG